MPYALGRARMVGFGVTVRRRAPGLPDHRAFPPATRLMAEESTPPLSPAPGRNARAEVPPGSMAGASRAPSAGLALYVELLQEASALGELDDAALAELAETLDDPREDALRLDLLAAYYLGRPPRPADPRHVTRRRADRFLLHRATDRSTARDVVTALNDVLPELGSIVLERIGGDDGPLVLRSGELIGPVVDDVDRAVDTNEIDLEELENDVETVAVRSIVRAANGLLRQAGVGERIVALRADATREAYLGVDRRAAERLFDARCLEEPSFDEVLDFSSWTA